MTNARKLLEKHFSDIGISLDVFGRVHWKSEVVRAALAAIEEAVREEREACASLCESLLKRPDGIPKSFFNNECAKAIRARGNEGEKR